MLEIVLWVIFSAIWYVVGYIDGRRKGRDGKVQVYIVERPGSWEKSNGKITIRFSEEQMN